MKELFIRLFISNWQRKTIALLFASTSWFLVNRSITKSQPPPFQLQESIALQAIHDEPLSLDVKLPLILVSTPSGHGVERPLNIEIAVNDLIEEKNGFYYLKLPLHISGASPLFLQIIKEKLALVLYLPSDSKNSLNWSVEVIDQKKAEEAYLATCLSRRDRTSEAILRNHFRNSLHQLALFTEKKRPLNLKASLEGNKVYIKLLK